MVQKEETIVDMAPDEKGVYKPVAIIHKRPPLVVRRKPGIFEFIDGFMYGLDALEQFIFRIGRVGGNFRK